MKYEHTAQMTIDTFEQKAKELVSLMLALTEEDMAAKPPALFGTSPVDSSALAVKYALDAFIKMMKSRKT